MLRYQSTNATTTGAALPFVLRYQSTTATTTGAALPFVLRYRSTNRDDIPNVPFTLRYLRANGKK